MDVVVVGFNGCPVPFQWMSRFASLDSRLASIPIRLLPIELRLFSMSARFSSMDVRFRLTPALAIPSVPSPPPVFVNVVLVSVTPEALPITVAPLIIQGPNRAEAPELRHTILYLAPGEVSGWSYKITRDSDCRLLFNCRWGIRRVKLN